MALQALLVELLISGFFAVACVRAREQASYSGALSPRTLLSLTNRIERLKRSRWQWFSIVLLLLVARMQIGRPIIAEFTALAMLVLFFAAPTAKQSLTSGMRRV